MKHWWIEYCQEWTESPMTCWVHRPGTSLPGERAEIEPPLPQPIFGKGYPIYFVTVGRFTFQFSSLHELDNCVETLAQKILPPTIWEHNGREYYANKHWLSRLPGNVKSWRYRQQAIKVLIKAKAAFIKELA
jgi:hypothetical protein